MAMNSIFITLFLSYCCCTVVLALPAARRCPASERAALLAFKNHSIVSDPDRLLSSWVAGGDCCLWAGVTCSNRTGRVEKLTLPPLDDGDGGYLNSFSPATMVAQEISTSLLGLQHLTSLSFTSMDFRGAQIPQFVGQFKHLQYLSLSYCNFSGQVPPHIGNLSQLAILILDSNTLYSRNLDWLPKLSSLRYLYFGAVDLSAVKGWTAHINKLSFLKVLALDNCQLQNDHLMHLNSNLTSLVSLDLGYNDFTMKLGSFRWFWSMTHLEEVYLDNNHFYGHLPPTLGNMTTMKIFSVFHNFLSGIFPTGLEMPCNLQFLSLEENNMEGDIAGLMERLPNCARHQLRVLDFGRNHFIGRLPSWIQEFQNLELLMIHNNNISGLIPELPKNLIVLDLGKNSLLGPIPSLLDQQELQVLILSFNRISGTIPSSICNLRKLRWLEIAINQLAGPIPRCPSILNVTQYFDVSGNMLTGGFPAFIRSCPQINYIDLSYNNFNGSLPLWIASNYER